MNFGEAAHITAASPNGPRYDPTLTSEQRSSIENGIFLCPTCAKMIDLDPIKYNAEKLRQWKLDAEERQCRDVTGDSNQPDKNMIQPKQTSLPSKPVPKSPSNPSSKPFSKRLLKQTSKQTSKRSPKRTTKPPSKHAGKTYNSELSYWQARSSAEALRITNELIAISRGIVPDYSDESCEKFIGIWNGEFRFLKIFPRKELDAVGLEIFILPEDAPEVDRLFGTMGLNPTRNLLSSKRWRYSQTFDTNNFNQFRPTLAAIISLSLKTAIKKLP
jgi:hypothetical protein